MLRRGTSCACWALGILLASKLVAAFVPVRLSGPVRNAGLQTLTSTFHGMKSVTIFSTQTTEEEGAKAPVKSRLPYPKVGDIVRYPAKWKDEANVGQIRFLQQIATRDDWIADIVPFKDIGNDLYRAKKGVGAVTHSVSQIRPLSAFYIGSSDAFKVSHSLNAEGKRVPVQLSLGYTMEGYTPESRKVDQAKVAQAKGEYKQLKERLLKDTALFGLGSTLVWGINTGIEDAAIFAAGVASSVLYLLLLSKKADNLGNGSPGGFKLPAGSTRFLVPVVLIGALALENLGASEGAEASTQLFNYVPRDQFWSAMLGFLSYRVPMLAREVGDALQRRQSDKKSVVGGSVRVGLSMVDRLRGRNKKDQTTFTQRTLSGSPAYRDEVTAIVVSGPEGMGKRELVRRLIKEDPQERFAAPVWVTARDPRPGEEDGVDYNFMEDFAFQVMKEQGRFLLTYQDEQGHWYGLRPSDIENVTYKQGRASVVALDPYQADKLLDLAGARVIAIWITLGDVKQLQERYTSLLGESEADGAVARAMDAIQHGLLETGFYEHTIYDDKGPEETYRRLRDFADFALNV